MCSHQSLGFHLGGGPQAHENQKQQQKNEWSDGWKDNPMNKQLVNWSFISVREPRALSDHQEALAKNAVY